MKHTFQLHRRMTALLLALTILTTLLAVPASAATVYSLSLIHI